MPWGTKREKMMIIPLIFQYFVMVICIVHIYPEFPMGRECTYLVPDKGETKVVFPFFTFNAQVQMQFNSINRMIEVKKLLPAQSVSTNRGPQFETETETETET